MVRIADHVGEAAHNRLLRRADWRFLLPNPWPAQSICFAQGQLRDATAAVSDVMVEAGVEQAGACDLAVAVNPDRATLARAWSALRPGGACYTEWYNPLVGGAVGVRRRLHRSGFSDVACYWPWPWPAHYRALFWLPMEAPNALAYFLNNRPRSASLVQAGSRAVARFLWQLGLKSRLVVPICAVACKPLEHSFTHAATVAMRPSHQPLLDLLRSQEMAWDDQPLPQRLSSLLLTGGQRSINKVVTLVFAERELVPRLIIKMPRVAESVAALRQEAAALWTVHGKRTGRIPGVPQLLWFEDAASHSRLAETVLTGQPLFTLLHRDNFEALALKATDWLVNLVAGSHLSPRSAWWNRLIEEPIHDFEQTFGSVIEHDLVMATRAILGTLDDLPLVCEQRDFSPWNVLLAPTRELVVLDWESAELQGLPALDLIYFLSYLAFFLDGAMHSHHFRPAYRATLDPQTFTGRVIHACLLRYAVAVGIDPAALRPLRILVWIIHTRAEYQRLAADGGGSPDGATLRRSLFVKLWEEEIRHALHAA